jgi:hypothetical protein
MTNFTPRCYIAGPMTGYQDHNYPAFHKAAAEMRALGWEVINPAENHGGNQSLPREDYFRTDIPQLVTCDAILMLNGWRKSKGALLEFAVARACGIRTIGDVQEPHWGLYGEDLRDLFPVVKLREIEPSACTRWDSWPRGERERAQGQNFVEFCQGVADIAPIAPQDTARVDALIDANGEPVSFTATFIEDDEGFIRRVATPQGDPFRALVDRVCDLHDKKKQDYTGGEHPLANYANSGESIGVSAVASMFSRLNEKVFRLKQLHKSGAAPQNESVIDSYMDVAILSLLSILALTPGSGYEQEAV